MDSQTHAVSHAGDAVPDEAHSRGALLRRIIIFQVKLFVDGLRDLVLSPVSIVAAALGIVFGGRNPHALFDHLMEAGHGSDRWIDLFGIHSRETGGPSLDRMIEDIEATLRDSHARGGLTAEAERRLRAVAEELRARVSGSARQGL